MQGFADFIKSLGAPRIAAMGAVTVALVGFFAFGVLITLYVLTDRRRSHLRRMESLPLDDGSERREQRHG